MHTDAIINLKILAAVWHVCKPFSEIVLTAGSARETHLRRRGFDMELVQAEADKIKYNSDAEALKLEGNAEVIKF